MTGSLAGLVEWVAPAQGALQRVQVEPAAAGGFRATV